MTVISAFDLDKLTNASRKEESQLVDALMYGWSCNYAAYMCIYIQEILVKL